MVELLHYRLENDPSPLSFVKYDAPGVFNRTNTNFYLYIQLQLLGNVRQFFNCSNITRRTLRN